MRQEREAWKSSQRRTPPQRRDWRRQTELPCVPDLRRASGAAAQGLDSQGPLRKMDPKVLQARAEEDQKIQMEREDMDQKIQLQRVEIKLKLEEVRAATDRAIQNERDNMDKNIKLERDIMDKILKESHSSTDQLIETQRVDIDSAKLQARAELDLMMIQREQESIHCKPTTEVPMEIPPSTGGIEEEKEEDLVMQFNVHIGGRFSFNPNGYIGGNIGLIRFMKPLKVEWHLFVENLAEFGFKGDAELYFLDPMREVPEGVVRMFGPEQVEELLLLHHGRKTGDLYIVNENTDDESDQYFGNAYSDDDGGEYDGDNQGWSKELLQDPTKSLEEGSDNNLVSGNKRDMECNEDDSSQPWKQHVVEHHGKAVNTPSSDEAKTMA